MFSGSRRAAAADRVAIASRSADRARGFLVSGFRKDRRLESPTGRDNHSWGPSGERRSDSLCEHHPCYDRAQFHRL